MKNSKKYMKFKENDLWFLSKLLKVSQIYKNSNMKT